MDYPLLLASFSALPAHARWSRQQQLHACLRAAIRDGRLAPGMRLLASRALAQELGVARNTVLYAYEQLATEGYVHSDRRGTVVAPVLAPSAPPPGPPAPHAALARRARHLRTLPVLEAAGAFAPGVPALEAFPLTLWRRLLERAWRAQRPQQLNYGPAAGEMPLRCAIADHLRAARGARVEPEQVFVTDGTQSSLELCARSFADAGDTVWVEHPGYGGALTAFRAAQLKPVGIAVDADGMAPQAADWRRRAPRLIYVTPSHQYPLGSVLSLERRLALIDGARRAGALIIEDDYDSEFRHDGPPLAAMQGLSADAPVLYLGTFSKTMFPALRIGFMVVPLALAAPLAALLATSAPRGRVAEQLALAEFMRGGHFALHLRRMRRLYRQRRDALVAALGAHLGGVASVHGGSAGMHLALRVGAEVDDVALSARLLQHGIVAPALSQHAFGARATPWHGLLLGYAQVEAARMDALAATIAAVLAAAGAGRAPSRGGRASIPSSR